MLGYLASDGRPLVAPVWFVVDGGSKDNTMEVLAPYADRFAAKLEPVPPADRDRYLFMLAARWPDELGQELADLNVQVEEAVRDFTRRRYGRLTASDLQRVTFALVDVPYAAARRYLLAGKPPPAGVDDLVAQACACLLDGQG